MNPTNQSKLIQEWCPEALAACPDFSIAPIEDFLPLLAGNAGASSSQVVTTGQVYTDVSATTTRLPPPNGYPNVLAPQQSGGIFPLAQGGLTMAPIVHPATLPVPAPPAPAPLPTLQVVGLSVKPKPTSADLIIDEDLLPGADDIVHCDWKGCHTDPRHKVDMWCHVKAAHTKGKKGKCRWGGCKQDLARDSFRKHIETYHLKLLRQCKYCGYTARQDSYLTAHGLARNCDRVPIPVAPMGPQPQAVAAPSNPLTPPKRSRPSATDRSSRHHPYDRAPARPKPGHLVAASTSRQALPSISKLCRRAQGWSSAPATPAASGCDHALDDTTYFTEFELPKLPSFGVAAKTDTARFGVAPAFPWHADVLPSNPVRSMEVEVAAAGPSTPPNHTAQAPIPTPEADVNPTPGPVDWATLGFDLGDFLVGQSNLAPPAMNLDPLFSFSALEQSTLNFPSPPPEPVVEVQETQPVNAGMQRTAEEILEIAQYCLFGSPAAENVDESSTGAHEEPEIDFSSFFREDPELYA
ncbi:hypothetical protein C8Q76DRAFT_798023 [Earliella scabrosa]|nr:hypothetical protein C8Q76DRAFT_798023 [Earliella scabrosa]